MFLPVSRHWENSTHTQEGPKGDNSAQDKGENSTHQRRTTKAKAVDQQDDRGEKRTAKTRPAAISVGGRFCCCSRTLSCQRQFVGFGCGCGCGWWLLVVGGLWLLLVSCWLLVGWLLLVGG